MTLDPKVVKDRLALAKRSRQLILNFCKATAIPDDFRDLRGIQEVRLRGNLLRELPDWMAAWKTITSIDLAQNPITTLPAWVADLPALEALNLDETAVSGLPDRLATLAKATSAKLAAARAAVKKSFADAAAAAREEAPKPTKAATKAPRTARKPPPPPWKPLGSVASVNASLSLLLADAADVASWEGADTKATSALARDKVVAVTNDGAPILLVPSNAGQGMADVGRVDDTFVVVEPGWEAILEAVDDAASATKAVGAAVQQTAKRVGAVEVKTGALVVASAWEELSGIAAARKRKVPVGAAREVDDAILVGLANGPYTIERTTVEVDGMDDAVVIVRIVPQAVAPSRGKAPAAKKRA